jgi:hypothetical protein
MIVQTKENRSMEEIEAALGFTSEKTGILLIRVFY